MGQVNNDTHFGGGHDLISLLLVKVFYGLGEDSWVSVGQVGQRFVASVIQLLRSGLQDKNKQLL